MRVAASGHLKLNCYKMKARMIHQEARGSKWATGRGGGGWLGYQATQIVGSGQPTEADQGPAKVRCRPIPRATGQHDHKPSPRADPWKHGDGWSCAVNGCNCAVNGAVRRHTWASRSILHTIMFQKGGICITVWWVWISGGSRLHFHNR